MNEKYEIGKKISIARKEKKMTQQELAEELHISDKAISNWETGKNQPDLEMLKKIEKTLNVEIIEKVVNKKQIYKKKFLITLEVIHIILSLLLLVYFINNFNKIRIYEVSLNDEFTIENSYIIVSNNEININLGQIENKTLPYQPNYDVTIYLENNKDIIFKQKNYKNKNIKIESSDKNYKLIKKNINNIYIKINYNDYENKSVQKEMKFILQKTISNNKLIYTKQSKEKNINQNEINLLKNNNYSKVTDNIYEKYNDKDYYRYNVEDKVLYYEGTIDNLKIYAQTDKNNKNAAVVLKDEKIIAYSIYNKNNLSKYKEIVLLKLSEIEKITYES